MTCNNTSVSVAAQTGRRQARTPALKPSTNASSQTAPPTHPRHIPVQIDGVPRRSSQPVRVTQEPLKKNTDSGTCNHYLPFLNRSPHNTVRSIHSTVTHTTHTTHNHFDITEQEIDSRYTIPYIYRQQRSPSPVRVTGYILPCLSSSRRSIVRHDGTHRTPAKRLAMTIGRKRTPSHIGNS